jgi:hypothetical protein
MKISVRGQNEKLTKAEIRDYIEFLSDMLMSPRLVKLLKINIKCAPLKKVKGFCMSVDDGYNVKPREFLIELDTKQSKASQLKTLAHEMVHVKQYAKGELADLSRQNKVRFNEKKYSANSFYWLQPWEIEAYGYEYGLYRMYRGIKNWKQNKKKFAEKYILS